MKTCVLLLTVVALAAAVEDTEESDRPQRSIEPPHNYEQINQVPTTYGEHIRQYVVNQPVPIPFRTPVAFAVQIPVHVPSPVPVEVQVPVPVYKTLTVPVDKEVPYPVVREIPVPVVRDVEVPVIKPYPVPVPIYKTKIIDHGTRHTYEHPPAKKGWWW